MTKDKIALFVGSGFSYNLGGYTTYNLSRAIEILFGNKESLNARIEKLNKEFFGNNLNPAQKEELKKTLLILMDGDNTNSLEKALQLRDKAIKDIENSYKKFFKKQNIQFRYYLQSLYKEFDLLAFKSFYFKWIKFSEDHDIVRFLTLLSKAYEENISIPTEELFKKDTNHGFDYIYYLRKDRIYKAINFFRYLIYKLFKLKLSFRPPNFRKNLKLYKIFFREILKNYYYLDVFPLKRIVQEDFMELPIYFITTNWDPFLPYLLIITNNELNREIKFYTLEGEPLCKFYVDFEIPAYISRLDFKLKKEHLKNFNSYSPVGGILITTDGAFSVNSHTKKTFLHNSSKVQVNLVIRLEKFYAIHGLFNLRVCPYCKKAFFIIPKDIRDINLETYEGLKDIFLLDPIPSSHDFKIINKVYKNTYIYYSYLKGRPDEINCPYCKHPTYFVDTPLSIQTIFKFGEDFHLHNIKLTAFQKLFQANHVVVIGYSFPEDDLINSYFMEFYTTSPSLVMQKKDRKITIIVYSEKFKDKIFYYKKDINNSMKQKLKKNKVIDLYTVEKIFGKHVNYRVSFWGFPDILNRISPQEILFFK